MDNLLKTQLYEIHASSGARMVPFAGWEMPIQYSSIINECNAVRNKAGIFDVSHMGRFMITGKDASLALDKILSVDPSLIEIGQGKYNLICDTNGGVIDDCIVYKMSDTKFLLIPNASNADSVHEWLNINTVGLEYRTEVITSKSTMIALQGPESGNILSSSIPEIGKIKRFRFIEHTLKSTNMIICRTGYTGEDGYEIILDNSIAVEFWDLLKTNGASECGLGARDVLRLEAALPLHGNEITKETNPFEAKLGMFVQLDRKNYIVNDVLTKIKSNEQNKKLIGFEIQGRNIARSHNTILDASDNVIGEVTSGSFSPTLNKSIGLAYVKKGFTDPDSEVKINIRSKNIIAKIIKTPFYKRSKNVS
tara:strand:+ start:5271 stop:6365 length:1095 start_codon:yes stop_codon:yes gene_type:complete